MKTFRISLLLFVGGILADDPKVFINTTGIGLGNLINRGYLRIEKSAASQDDDSSYNTTLLPLDEIFSKYGNPNHLLSDDDMKTVDDVIGITNDILDIGAAIQPLDKIFGPLSALGKLILDCFHIGKRDDPVMNKLDDISHQIDQLGKQMRQELDDLKAYMSETVFNIEILQPALLLNELMKDTLKFPGNDSIAKFYDAYKAYPPFQMGYVRRRMRKKDNCDFQKIVDFMKERTTNPLYETMEADRLKTTRTFNRWSKTLLNAMLQFMYIETYANGMFDNSTLYGPHRLQDKFNELNSTIQYWSRYYKNSYWPSVVQTMIEDIQDDYVHLFNDDKARLMKSRVMEILQEDKYLYWVVVYDPVSGNKDHALGGSEYLYSFKRGKCNAVVMRTLKSRDKNWDFYNAMNAAIPLERHRKKKEKNRSQKMLNDARNYNPAATNNLFIVGAHPAYYLTEGAYGTAYATKYGALWLATF